MNLELRHLRVVCAIAETGSVTKAASTLGLAQPALTAQLQRIERTLGGPLFERDRRGARPTALGELVLARARVLLPAMKGLQDEAARLAGATDAPRRYRFGGVNSPFLGRLVHRVAAAQPQAQITTYASWSVDELAQLVVGGRLDFVLTGVCGDSSPSAECGLSWREVSVDPVLVLLPESHPLAEREEVRLVDLRHEQWVAAPGDGCFGDCFAAACARAGFTPRKLYETDVRGCVDLVDAGEAVALCQATFRPPAGLVTRRLAGVPLRWRLMFGWHPDSPAARAAEWVLQTAKAAYDDSLAPHPAYLAWLVANPEFGVRRSAVLAPVADANGVRTA
ncbi:LysR family transcriptional regulator [Micromonospora musae]|uniref:LysR family transcriptional regulator n=1 Tax=Micromonospora musae TaxID=1894970 RepID=A0A3A9YN14_9ACTN|nr:MULTISPECIES: LysR family transcriptional regulator [Micromonospora]RKN15349.1 LysR family transcriptional regulator [Micromonospora musae]RKN36137.1 LysR family transcriptional regulator [Micromonospora musae]TYB97111.1 LysR family transcriptional regulator [Micromonospora sp. WP24]